MKGISMKGKAWVMAVTPLLALTACSHQGVLDPAGPVAAG